MPRRGSAGAGISAGAGTSQFGGDQTLPSGFSVLRSNWQDARAMPTPPLMNSASTTLMRRPSRMTREATSIGAKPGRRNMSTVSRAGTKSSPPWRCSMAKASRPTMTRPCNELGSHGPFAAAVGMKRSPSRVKKGRVLMARDHEASFPVKSRVGGAEPFRADAAVELARTPVPGKRYELIARQQLRQRPRRGAAHQRALVGEQALGFGGERRVFRVADRDQHIADEPVAADAFYR